MNDELRERYYRPWSLASPKPHLSSSVSPTGTDGSARGALRASAGRRSHRIGYGPAGCRLRPRQLQDTERLLMR